MSSQIELDDHTFLEVPNCDPERVILHAFRSIEMRLRTEHRLDKTPISEAFEELKRQGKLSELLYNQLKTLKRLRNDTVHNSHKPTIGDALIAAGTLKNFYQHHGEPHFMRAFRRFPEKGAPSSAVVTEKTGKLDWREFQERSRQFFEETLGRNLAEEVALELPGGMHRFDLAAVDKSTLIECKSYTWLQSGKRPSAKWAQAQMACRHLGEAEAARKILVFQDDIVQGKSFAAEFVRLNGRLLRGIEVWRYFGGVFEQLWPPATLVS